jgi:hypothetical protein
MVLTLLGSDSAVTRIKGFKKVGFRILASAPDVRPKKTIMNADNNRIELKIVFILASIGDCYRAEHK